MNARVLMLTVLFGGLAAAPAAGSASRAGAHGRGAVLQTGAKLLADNQCARCHGGRGIQELAEPLVGETCHGCHAWVRATNTDPVEQAAARERYPLWNRYEDRVRDFQVVPDLGVSGARLSPEWIARYLRAPYHVRPGLREEMIRTALSEEDAKAIAARLTAGRAPLTGIAAKAAAIAPSAAAEDVAEGQRLFAQLACTSCHSLAGLPLRVPGTHMAPGIAGAPDLATTRDRMRPADISAFLADPAAFGGVTAMPSFDLTAEQAARLRDFLLAAPVPASTASAAAPDLPLLTRAVAWDEVKERVFGVTCIHCHMDAAANGGDGGAGNTGGLGYAGARLNLETWEGVTAGATVDGKRISILQAAFPDQDPPLVARLRRRMGENAAERIGPQAVTAGGAEPGMPLGLPAVTAEQLQLVRSWIAQGAPGPAGSKGIRLASSIGPGSLGSGALGCGGFVAIPRDVLALKLSAPQTVRAPRMAKRTAEPAKKAARPLAKAAPPPLLKIASEPVKPSGSFDFASLSCAGPGILPEDLLVRPEPPVADKAVACTDTHNCPFPARGPK